MNSEIKTFDDAFNLLESTIDLCDQFAISLTNGVLNESVGENISNIFKKILKFIQSVIDKISRFLDSKLDNNYAKADAEYKRMCDKIENLEKELKKQNEYSAEKDKLILEYEKKIQLLGNFIAERDKEFETLFKQHMKKLNEFLTKLDEAGKNEANYKKKIRALETTLNMIRKHSGIKKGSFVAADNLEVHRLVTDKLEMSKCINTLDDLFEMCKHPEKASDDKLIEINNKLDKWLDNSHPVMIPKGTPIDKSTVSNFDKFKNKIENIKRYLSNDKNGFNSEKFTNNIHIISTLNKYYRLISTIGMSYLLLTEGNKGPQYK